MRFFASIAALAPVALALFLSCSSEPPTNEPEKLCEPGEEIFCRCPGGESGTKTCNQDGLSFDSCFGRSGPCQEEPTGAGGSGGSSTTSTSSATSTSTTTGSSGGSGGGNPTKSALYEPCGVGDDCESGLCPMGYCTKTCAKISDCDPAQAECVTFDGATRCMPTCATQSDCDPFLPPSECGYTSAVDGFKVTTCADWLSSLQLPPDGSSCNSDIQCNLGHTGKERVCSFGACTKGCYQTSDCPGSKTCPSQGQLATCKF